jgi:hypothetical protein
LVIKPRAHLAFSLPHRYFQLHPTTMYKLITVSYIGFFIAAWDLQRPHRPRNFLDNVIRDVCRPRHSAGTPSAARSTAAFPLSTPSTPPVLPPAAPLVLPSAVSSAVLTVPWALLKPVVVASPAAIITAPDILKPTIDPRTNTGFALSTATAPNANVQYVTSLYHALASIVLLVILAFNASFALRSLEKLSTSAIGTMVIINIAIVALETLPPVHVRVTAHWLQDSVPRRVL